MYSVIGSQILVLLPDASRPVEIRRAVVEEALFYGRE